MTKQIEALNIAIDYLNERLEDHDAKYQRHPATEQERNNIISDAETIKEALAQPEQRYRRGDRLICLETEEYCVIHISGTDRQWVKFPDSHIGVYTNEQVAELFELLPKEPEQEPVALQMDVIVVNLVREGINKHRARELAEHFIKHTTPPQRTWVDLTDDEMLMIYGQNHEGKKYNLGRLVQKALQEKNYPKD